MDADQQLMARVRDGDRGAFEALYARFGSPVMRFLYRLCGDRVLAEDLTQDVFLKVWRAAAGWRPVGKVGTWLFQIAKHHWWNEAAKRRRRAAVQDTSLTAEVEARAQDEHAPAPTERMARVESARAVEAALAGLSPKLRLVFVLVRLEGLAYAQAAEIAGIPVGTVKSRAAAAEAALRRALSHPRHPHPKDRTP